MMGLWRGSKGARSRLSISCTTLQGLSEEGKEGSGPASTAECPPAEDLPLKHLSDAAVAAAEAAREEPAGGSGEGEGPASSGGGAAAAADEEQRAASPPPEAEQQQPAQPSDTQQATAPAQPPAQVQLPAAPTLGKSGKPKLPRPGGALNRRPAHCTLCAVMLHLGSTVAGFCSALHACP